MVHYKLIYLDLNARAEVTRMLFFLGGKAFEDIRFDISEIPKYKPSAPFGQFPVLEVDGVKMCQSHSINRYLANQFGYAGKTPLDKLRADMIVDWTEDMVKVFRPTMFGESGYEPKWDKKDEFGREKLPVMLGNLENILKENGGGDGYFVGDELTWADLTVHHLVTWLQGWEVTIDLEKTPKLKAFLRRVETNPRIVEWREKTRISRHPLDIYRGKEQLNM